jgi:hypothetical protein
MGHPEICSPELPETLGQDLRYHFPGNVGQAEVAALELER